MRIDIKPLSVNRAWKGRRFKTIEYKKYERDLLLLLKPMKVPHGNLELVIEFGLSNMLSDFDNPVKPFVDVLQKKYGFNDRQIQQAHIRKVLTEKRREYIKFELNSLADNK